jgi:hypothetical protein
MHRPWGDRRTGYASFSAWHTHGPMQARGLLLATLRWHAPHEEDTPVHEDNPPGSRSGGGNRFVLPWRVCLGKSSSLTGVAWVGHSPMEKPRRAVLC